MHLSHRITGITGGGSDGWGVFYKARRMNADGEAVVELTIGEHDIRTDPAILAAMNASATGGNTGYAAAARLRRGCWQRRMWSGQFRARGRCI